MMNDRPLNNADIQHVLNEFQRLCRTYDLVGACTVIDAKESGFTYALYTTWNGIALDATVQPLGFRIRIKTDEQGPERAHQLAAGTAWTFGALMDFGTQTRQWGRDLMQMLRQAGMRIDHRPFGGTILPHITSTKP